MGWGWGWVADTPEQWRRQVSVKIRRRNIYPLHHCCLLCHVLARNTTIKIETREVISRHPVIAISILNHFFITISKRSTSTSTIFKNSDNCWYSHWKFVTSLTDERGEISVGCYQSTSMLCWFGVSTWSESTRPLYGYIITDQSWIS